MKKILLVSLIIVIVLSISKTAADEIKIPNDAIRIRVIANSNSKKDQETKSVVRKDLETKMFTLLNKASNIDEARTIVLNNLSNITKSVENTLIENKYDLSFDINYGNNYFPEKLYKGVKYDAGNYESLVVTLGEGNGSNWWCVLFPPLCLIEAEENENIDDVEYKFFIKKIIDKYVS